MTEIEELVRTFRSLGEALESLGVAWAVGGSLASATYGEPRATNDVDIVALLDEASARELGRLLGDDFYCSAEAATEAVRERSSFNVIDRRSFIKIDVFVPPAGPLGRGQLARRRVIELLPGVSVPVLGPEDVVLQKLRWFRIGGGVSDRQWRDVVSVIGAGGLDDTFLDSVAASEGLSELLLRARDDAET